MYTHTCGWGWDTQVGHMWAWSAHINCVCSYACCAVYVHAWNMLVHYIVPVYDGERPSANGIWETGGDGETPSTNSLCEVGPGWHMTLGTQRKLPPAHLSPFFFTLHPLGLDPMPVPWVFCSSHFYHILLLTVSRPRASAGVKRVPLPDSHCRTYCLSFILKPCSLFVSHELFTGRKLYGCILWTWYLRKIQTDICSTQNHKDSEK